MNMYDPMYSKVRNRLTTIKNLEVAIPSFLNTTTKKELREEAMKARRRVGANGGGGGGGPPTDLLVCFPTRAHLTLMPKPVSSPSRAADHSKRNHHHQSIPMFRTNRAQKKEDIASEPTSPKVTCAGQIKVRPKNRAAGRPESKNWLGSVGLRKDVTNFVGALRGLRFSMQCFGMFHAPVVCSSDEDEEEEEPAGGSQCKNIFSKWFMVLEENQQKGDGHFDHEFNKEEEEEEEDEDEEEEEKVELPPKNALLLMRCRSAPSRRGEEEEEEKAEEDQDRLMIMSYAPDCFKLSTDIAKETWLVGSANPILARSRSWRR